MVKHDLFVSLIIVRLCILTHAHFFCVVVYCFEICRSLWCRHCCCTAQKN